MCVGRHQRQDLIASETRGKTYFIPFIKPMLRISIRTAESLGRFPEIRRILVPLAE